jgi:hypothetical protein
MKRVLRPTFWFFVVAALGAGLSAVSGMSYWWAFAIVAAALVINGWVATLEDDLPGGFNNPDGTSTPKYAVIAGWVVRGLGAILALLCLAILGLYFFGGL